MFERLERLESNVADLREFRKKHELNEVMGSRELQWALRYGLLESIQAMIDVSCHLCVERNLGNPDTYRLLGSLGDTVEFAESIRRIE